MEALEQCTKSKKKMCKMTLLQCKLNAIDSHRDRHKYTIVSHWVFWISNTDSRTTGQHQNSQERCLAPKRVC